MKWLPREHARFITHAKIIAICRKKNHKKTPTKIKQKELL